MSRPTRADPGGRAYLDLQNLGRREGRSTQALLVMYVLERFLARLAAGPHAARFILKGGMQLAALDARRATVDADFLVRGPTLDRDVMLALVLEIADSPGAVEDGVEYLTHTAVATTIRDGDLYQGVRVRMLTKVAAAEVKLQLDISAGDPVVPSPQSIRYPSLREAQPGFTVVAYPIVMVLAEKLCTALELGEGNSRVRDYADVWTLTGQHDVGAGELAAAILATAVHRRVMIRPLSSAIGDIARVRGPGYVAYRRRLGVDAKQLPQDFTEVVGGVITFADPVLTPTMASGSRWHASTRCWDPISVPSPGTEIRFR